MTSEEDHLEDVIGHDEDELEEEDDDLMPSNENDSPGRKYRRKRDSAGQLRKAPQAPKRFKSNYICFFLAKQPEIKEELGDKATVSSISKRSAELWKSLTSEQRAHWDDVALKDKQRYMVEKSTYTGPWQVPWKRAKKDPSAPKRPMSAFLYFAQGRRTKIKDENPDMKNTEISRILGEMWRNLTDAERLPFVENEKSQREKYKVAVAEWKVECDVKLEADRKAQTDQHLMMQQGGDPNMPMQPPPMMYPDPQYGQPTYMYAPPGYAYLYPPHHPPPGGFPMPPGGNSKHPVILAPNGLPRFPMPYPPPPQMLPPPPGPGGNGGEQDQPPGQYGQDQHHSPEAFGVYGADPADQTATIE